jgi:hypothetical protein
MPWGSGAPLAVEGYRLLKIGASKAVELSLWNSSLLIFPFCPFFLSFCLGDTEEAEKPYLARE